MMIPEISKRGKELTEGFRMRRVKLGVASKNLASKKEK